MLKSIYQDESIQPLFLAGAILAAISLILFKVPPILLDIGLVLSFALSIYMMTIAISIKTPLEYSSFPLILLLSIILRLCLSVASAKLIISNGHEGTHSAGHLIESFAGFIISGNLIIGIVVFIIITIVNYMVITKGASRMAEVSARFALDSMPGKQMSIDADLASGALNHEQARKRRATELAEVTFFGSLDGASKFVKGDAVAGILITMINITFGMVNGFFYKDLELSSAVSTYTILTIGDALVTQLPALVTAIASAIILTKSDNSKSNESFKISDILDYPKPMMLCAISLLAIGLIPSIPAAPFLLISVIFGVVAILNIRNKSADLIDISRTQDAGKTMQSTTIEDFSIESIHLQVAPNLVDLITNASNGVETKIENVRKFIFLRYGLSIPEIRISDSTSLIDDSYRIKLFETDIARGSVSPKKLLAILGNLNPLLNHEVVMEPVYNTRCQWISYDEEDQALTKGMQIIKPSDAICTHLLETIKRNLGYLMTMKATRKIVESYASESEKSGDMINKRIVEEIIPETVSMDRIQATLKHLLEDGITIKNMDLILESLVEAKRHINFIDCYEHVRQKLNRYIIEPNLTNKGGLKVLQLSQDWYIEIDHIANAELLADTLTTRFELLQNLSDKITSYQHDNFILAVPSSKRRILNDLLKKVGNNIPIVSLSEIPSDIKTEECLVLSKS